MKRLVLISLFILIGVSSVSEASIEVGPGYDIFYTENTTSFMGVNWEGVSLGNYDFGGTVGVKDAGDADTIVQRIDPATVPGDGQTDTIEIELVALQLRSVGIFDPDGAGPAPSGNYFITLQDGEDNMGTMDITFDDQDGGTFESIFDVFFDLRFGALDGPIISSDVLTMTSIDNVWSRIAPGLGEVVIEGVDYLLNGIDTAMDFWPGVHVGGLVVDTIVEEHPSGAHHDVKVTPEPTTICLLGLGGLLLRRRKNA